MSKPSSKSPLTVTATAIRGISLSLGLSVLLGSSASVFAQDMPRPNNVRIPPSSPTETGDSSEDGIPTATNARFTCEVVDGEYTVMYHPQSQPGESYEWAQPSTLGGGWTSDRRCAEIARRLEFYREDGMKELALGYENGYDTICVTTEKNPTCQIVLTVPPGEDPELIRDRVFENLSVADSGRQTEAVNAIVDNGQGGSLWGTLEDATGISLPGGGGSGNAIANPNAINLRPFLDPADGGTGTNLTGGMGSRSNPQLNPENFR